MKGSAITGPVAKECVRRALSTHITQSTDSSFETTGGSVAPYRSKRWYRGLIDYFFFCSYIPRLLFCFLPTNASPPLRTQYQKIN